MATSTPELWRQIIRGDTKSWALFANDTCVIVMLPDGDLATQATAIMAQYGPVHVGTPAGDFGVIHLHDAPGWVVYGHHPDMLTYVSPDEAGADPSDLVIGMLGRGKRDLDGRSPTVVHVEDKRSAEG
ncbi:MAG: hypothetical protein R3A52_24630 [Polyangiales bacterium]